jgi:hypothetical protein
MSNDSRDNSIEYLREQSRLALERGDKQGCAILTFAHELLAAQSRHEAEREALVSASKLGIATLKDCLEAFGDCDHSVGICNCDIKRAIDAMNSVLLSDSGSQG